MSDSTKTLNAKVQLIIPELPFTPPIEVTYEHKTGRLSPQEREQKILCPALKAALDANSRFRKLLLSGFGINNPSTEQIGSWKIQDIFYPAESPFDKQWRVLRMGWSGTFHGGDQRLSALKCREPQERELRS